MQIIKKKFNDFDIYNEAVEDWSLDYTLLSKKDFSVKLNMFTGEKFAISRISFQGKLIHFGTTPEGFRTLVVPVNYNDRFIWYNKGSGGNELLIFKKNLEINAVTFSGYDAYIVSIENELLKSTVNKLNYSNCRVLFDDSEKEFHLTKSFSEEFHLLADEFLTDYIKDENFIISNPIQHEKWISTFIYELLTYIEKSPKKKNEISKNKKENALNEAIELIHKHPENLYSVKELSVLTNISERTLLYAFKEKYKVSPSEFIKASRLNKVKNELYALKDTNTSIATIAGKYHFWHMGQFAKDFKKQFGKLPSEVRKE